MIGWLRTLLGMLGLVTTIGIIRHGFRTAGGHTPGGSLVRDASAYDAFSRRILGPFFRGIADDIAEAVPDRAQILEVGCGPGHLSIQVARKHGLGVTGIDLDPAMIEQARANAMQLGVGRPSFQVGDVAQLPFPDQSFDLVVSTLSMHHWADPTSGFSEISRVLRPGGRALIWDLRPGIWHRHRHVPDPVEHAQSSGLRVVDATPWRWPWKLSLTQRIEMARPETPAGHTEPHTHEARRDKGAAYD